MLKDGPITRFLKKRIPLVDMELWSGIVALLGAAIIIKVWNNLGFIDWVGFFYGAVPWI